MKFFLILLTTIFFGVVIYFNYFFVDTSKYVNFQNDIESKLHTLSVKSIPEGVSLDEYSVMFISEINDYEQSKLRIIDFIKENKYKAISFGCFKYKDCGPLIEDAFSDLIKNNYKSDKYIIFFGPKIYQNDFEKMIGKLGANFLFVEFNPDVPN